MATSSSQNDSSENHVLLTGGNGFVASHILSDLVNVKHQGILQLLTSGIIANQVDH